MSIFVQAIKCFALAVFWGLSPFAIGYVLGWIMCKEEKQDNFTKNAWHLKNVIIRLYIEGKISDTEKSMLDKAVNELLEEHKNGK